MKRRGDLKLEVDVCMNVRCPVMKFVSVSCIFC
jgi:hypothetical protein